MIAAVRGTLAEKSLDSAFITVGGVTLRILTPFTALTDLTPGEVVTLHTYLLVREDLLALYGFATPDDRDMFERLLGVGGVGPRIALALLSGMHAQQLYEAVLTEDLDRLSMAPGVGRKLAARLVLELRPKFEKLSPISGAAAGGRGGAGNARAQVIEALTGLGYSAAQAANAVRGLTDEGGADLSDMIARALRNLAQE